MWITGNRPLLLAGVILACEPKTEAGPGPVGPGPSVPRADWSVGRGQVAWSSTEGEGRGVVSQNDSLVFVPGRARTLYAFRKATGELVWKARTTMEQGGTRGLGSAATASTVVMADADLHAFDTRTGARKWLFSGDGQYPGNSNPAADPNGLRFYSGSFRGTVWALDAESGAVLWSSPSPDGDSLAAFDPVIAGNDVYVGYSTMNNVRRGGLAAYDATTGRRLWYHNFRQYVTGFESPSCFGNVAVLGDLVYATVDQGFVVAIERSTGSLRWKTGPFPDVFPASPDPRGVTVAGGYVVTVGSRGVFNGLDPATGAIRWRTPGNAGSYSAFTVDSSFAYSVLTGDGLVVLNPVNGQVAWSAGVTPPDYRRPPVSGRPAIDTRGVYVGSTESVMAFKR